MATVVPQIAISPLATDGAPSRPAQTQFKVYKAMLCHYNNHGRCHRGSACTFAHSTSELRAYPDMKKFKLCQMFAKYNVCTYTSKGANKGECPFAHSHEELNNAKEKALAKPALCAKYLSTGSCSKGVSCSFAHSIVEVDTAYATDSSTNSSSINFPSYSKTTSTSPAICSSLLGPFRHAAPPPPPPPPTLPTTRSDCCAARNQNNPSLVPERSIWSVSSCASTPPSSIPISPITPLHIDDIVGNPFTATSKSNAEENTCTPKLVLSPSSVSTASSGIASRGNNRDQIQFHARNSSLFGQQSVASPNTIGDGYSSTVSRKKVQVPLPSSHIPRDSKCQSPKNSHSAAVFPSPPPLSELYRDMTDNTHAGICESNNNFANMNINDTSNESCFVQRIQNLRCQISSNKLSELLRSAMPPIYTV